MKNLYLKSIRVARGATQAACAKAAGVSEAGYNRVENGKTALSENCWRKLAAFLGVTYEAITDKAAAADYDRVVNAILASSGLGNANTTGATKAKYDPRDFCVKPKLFFTK